MPHSKDKRQRTSSTSSESSSSSWPNSVTSRAERSRHAAKMRRDKEGVEISTLAKLLPYPDEVTNKLDKGSIIRLTTSYLRMKKFTQKDGQTLLEEAQQKAITSGEGTEDAQGTTKKESSNEGTLMLQALNGFVIFVSRKGKIFFISDNVGKHLGVHQYEMIGNSVMEFIHPDDHKELAKQFVVQVPGRVSVKGMGVENSEDSPTSMTVNFFDDSVGDEAQIPITDYIQDRQFFLRMRSVMSRRGTGGKGKVVGFRVVNFSGRLKLKRSANQKGYMVEGLVCLCRPIQPQPILEIRMDGNMFMSRHGLDMSFTFCDPRIITLIGYEPHELLGKTAYQFHNPLDASKVSDCHSKLIDKGSSMSKYYRFMGKNGDWVWLQTKATIIYNTNNVAQYVVCMNYVIGSDEGERHLLMEHMQKAAAAACAAVAKDSDCGESMSSPGSVASCHSSSAAAGSPATSGVASGSDIEEVVIKMEVTEEPIDVTQFIPEAVRNNEPILKPQPKKEDISFAKLLQTDNLKPLMYGVEAMDTSPSPGRSSTVETCAKIEGQGTNDCSLVQPVRTSVTHSIDEASKLESAEKPYSPISETDSSCSVSSGSVNSPPTALDGSSSSGGQLTGVQEEEESLFRDLLEITKNDTEDHLPNEGGSQNFLFSVNSPDNLSQFLGSPGNASMSINSPSAASMLMDDVTSPKIPGKSDRTLPSGNILASLLNSKACSDVATQEGIENTPGGNNRSLLSMCVTKIDQPQGFNIDPVLPDELADFSLDFCRNVMDQTAADIVTSLAGNLDLVQSFENTMVGKESNTPGATICEVDDITAPSTSKAGDSQNVASPQTTSSPDLTEPVTPLTPVTQVSRSNTSEQGKHSGQTNNKYPIPMTIPVPTNISMPAVSVPQPQQPPPYPTLQEPLNVTERISRLDIKDRQRQENQGGNGEKTPLLHALLTGAEANPVAVPPVVNNASTASVGMQNGVNGVQESFVDSFDAFLQNMNNVSAPATADTPSINNNMLNQDDLTLLQQHEQQRSILMQEQVRAQEKLLEQQMQQQQMMENKFKEQLLQRKRLQTAMEMERKLQQVQMQQQSSMMCSPGSTGMNLQQNILPHQTASLTNHQQQQHAGVVPNASAGQMFSPQQQLRMPSNPVPNQTVGGITNCKQQAQVNFPIPNLTAADIQQLQQQKLQQQQMKQQLLLQQQQQQELRQLQQRQQMAVHQQQQTPIGTSTGQPLLLQQAFLQQQQSHQPTSTSQSAMNTGSYPQFSLGSSSPTSSWTSTTTQWSPTNLVNTAKSQAQ